MTTTAVANAARATIASGSARVSRLRFSEPKDPDFALPLEEGVTDFARVRTRVESAPGDLPEWATELFAQRFGDRWARTSVIRD